MSKGNHRNKSGVETDFVEGNGWYIELVRSTNSSPVFVLFEIKGEKATAKKSFVLQGRLLVPPEEDELSRHIRFSQKIGDYHSVQNLLQQIDSFISRCLDLNPEHRFLLACFVVSTWVVDRLPIAPILAIVGLSQSGKTTALNVLHLLCRRSILTSDISSATFYRMCDRLIPTVLIDNTGTAGLQRKLFHFLRSGTSPDIVRSGWSQSYRTYGSKVVTWTELPNDEALNSRCVIIPMQETSRTDLQRPNYPEIVAAAGTLQGRLLKFRFEKYSTVQLAQVPVPKHLRSRNRDLYEALALPIADDREACVRLLECMGQQHMLHDPSLPPDQTAVLETLFHYIHIHPEQGTLAFRHLTQNVNLNLEQAGERFRLTPKGVGTELKTLGLLSDRKRTSLGWAGFLDRATQKRIHELVSRHGLDGIADGSPSQMLEEPCEFCKARDAQSPESSPDKIPTSRVNNGEKDPNPLGDTQTSVQSEKDATQPLGEPNSGGAPSFPQTEDIGSPRWIESQEDQDWVDNFKEDAELKKMS